MQRFKNTSLAILFSFFFLNNYCQNYSFLEGFEYNSFDDFKITTESNKFIFDQLISLDLNGDGIIDSQEQIKLPNILGVKNNKFLQVRLKNNNYNPEQQSHMNGGYGNYLRRSELVYNHYLNQNNNYIMSGDEFWYGFKINLKQFIPDTDSCYIDDENMDVFNQILIGDWQLDNLPELAMGPIFKIAVFEDKWKLYFTNFSSGERENFTLNDEIIEINEWTEFIVHFKISSDEDAFIKIWKDDQLVFEKYNFKNTPEPNLRHYFKFGLYKPHINTCPTNMIFNDPLTDKIIYFDDIWMNNHDLSKGLRLIDEDCDKIVTMEDPYISVIDVPRESPYIVLLRNLNTNQDVYFSSSTSLINLLEVLPSNLSSNSNYRINVRIDGHPWFHNYSTNIYCRDFQTGDLSLRLVDEDCDKIVTNYDPYINLIDVPRESPYIVLLRNLDTNQDVYFTSQNALINLHQIQPSNLASNTNYRINARINGHSIFNNYSSTITCKDFQTGNLNTPIDIQEKNNVLIKNGSIHKPYTIFPNPFSTIITVEGAENNNSYKIIDINGRIISDFNKAENKSINLEHIPSGFYFLKIDDNNKSYIYKIIKK